MLFIHGHETVKVPLVATPNTAQGNRCYRALYRRGQDSNPRPSACETKNYSSEPPVEHSVEFVKEIKAHALDKKQNFLDGEKFKHQ